MLTPWADTLDRAQPLPEYPRPQMVRDSYLNLNGPWSYAITTSAQKPAQADGTILVPFSPESLLSGVGRQLQPDELLWYVRRVSVPAMGEGERCLHCNTVCQVCADVCPNRANVVITLPDSRHEILHVDRMCNECGNCAVFCPYQEGRPYKDKLTLFWSEEDMENSENEGFLAVDEDHFKVRVAGTVRTVSVDAVNTGLPEAVRLTIRAVRDNYSYLLKK